MNWTQAHSGNCLDVMSTIAQLATVAGYWGSEAMHVTLVVVVVVDL